jgi:hypothetical protein
MQKGACFDFCPDNPLYDYAGGSRSEEESVALKQRAWPLEADEGMNRKEGQSKRNRKANRSATPPKAGTEKHTKPK